MMEWLVGWTGPLKPRRNRRGWCKQCQCRFGVGNCDVCRLDRGEDPYGDGKSPYRKGQDLDRNGE
jgi:hypothetical protein